MLTNTYDEMIKLLDQQFSCLNVSKGIIQKVVSKYSFENQTKRKPGEENTNSFLRKGVSGDWKNYFNEEAKDIFKRHAGDLLIKLGYEKDLNW
jgi:DNA gyrase/topoisomerase IV subunit B